MVLSGAVSVSFTCTAHVSDQSFTVPSIVLLGLPPSGSSAPGGPVIQGDLAVETYDYQPFSPIPSGLNAALVASFFSYSASVTYQ